MNYEEIFVKLSENPQNVSCEAVRLLVKIADNIISDPSNNKIRTLQKSNSSVIKKILPAKGAVECLKLMGFQETRDSFNIPPSVPVERVEEIKNAIIMWKDSVDISKSHNKRNTVLVPNNAARPLTEQTNTSQQSCSIQKESLPPIKASSMAFFLNMETHFQNCMQYEQKYLQTKAKSLLPIDRLENGAQIRLRSIQEEIKKNKLPDPDLSVQDMLILELLRWFKDEFFSWVDTLPCEKCGGKTKFSHRAIEENLLTFYDVENIEMHMCVTCRHLTPFPRYDDLDVLLNTRRGRCGEWANTFTLFCRALGWDARFVVEEGDHVWTEVYSIAQKRWLHCDPCENACDTPLVYESGWNKKISYVMAYSAEEVQDVTWRYTSNHKETLRRRHKCSEEELVAYLIRMRNDKQKTFTEARKNYLTKRILFELAELMQERKPDGKDHHGRTSGSSMWRLARGETTLSEECASHVWKIKNEHILDNQVTIRYSAALDKYEMVSGTQSKNMTEIKKWIAGACESTDVFRKEEKDWKQVYLARKEGVEIGEISWKFEIETGSKTLDYVVLDFDYATYENGKIKVKLCLDGTCVFLPDGERTLSTKNFSRSKSVVVTASLSGGKGDVAWQHAQLFRQKTDSNEISAIRLFVNKIVAKNPTKLDHHV